MTTRGKRPRVWSLEPMVERENQVRKVVLWPPHVQICTNILTLYIDADTLHNR